MTIRPFIVEFTGTPEAGKTTTIKELKRQLESRNFTVKVCRESAEIIPKDIPKESWDANLWISERTIQSMKSMIDSSTDIIIVDRGTIDRIFWGKLHYYKGMCPRQELTEYEQLIINANLEPDFLVVLTVKDNEAIRRRRGEGRIVTKEFIKTYNEMLDEFYNNLLLSKILIDTTDKTIDEIVSKIINSILKKHQ